MQRARARRSRRRAAAVALLLAGALLLVPRAPADEARLTDPAAELERLRAAAAGDPAGSEGRALRRLLEDLERFEEALELCERQLTRSPGDVELHRARIELLFLLSRFEEAERAAVAALGRFPADPGFQTARRQAGERLREAAEVARVSRRLGLLSGLAAALVITGAALAAWALRARDRQGGTSGGRHGLKPRRGSG